MTFDTVIRETPDLGEHSQYTIADQHISCRLPTVCRKPAGNVLICDGILTMFAQIRCFPNYCVKGHVLDRGNTEAGLIWGES
jgi:hypothetical protein